jgi:hypothetical protein
MIESLPPAAHRQNRGLTLALLIAGCLLIASALGLGLAGIEAAIIPAYLGTSAFIAAIAHRWRRIRSFLILFAACLAGFVLFVILHNLFYALGSHFHGLAALVQILGAMEVITFILAVVVCPPGALIGMLGSALLGLRRLF